MIRNISIKDLRAHLAMVMENVSAKLDRYIISKRGIPEAVLMSVDDYESILETTEIQGDKELMKSIKRGEKDIKSGRVISLEELEKDLGLV